jgi:hypothetical protein
VDTVSGREYGPGPKSVLLRSVERVIWPFAPAVSPPLRRAKMDEAVPTCAVSGGGTGSGAYGLKLSNGGLFSM